MLTSNSTTCANLPSTADLIGTTIQYVNARPYQRQSLYATGLVIGWQVYRNLLMLKVQNTETCRERWINAQYDFLNAVPEIIRRTEQAELEDDPDYNQYLHDLAETEYEQEMD